MRRYLDSKTQLVAYGDPTPSSWSVGTRHAHNRHTCRQSTHTPKSRPRKDKSDSNVLSLKGGDVNEAVESTTQLFLINKDVNKLLSTRRHQCRPEMTPSKSTLVNQWIYWGYVQNSETLSATSVKSLSAQVIPQNATPLELSAESVSYSYSRCVGSLQKGACESF